MAVTRYVIKLFECVYIVNDFSVFSRFRFETFESRFVRSLGVNLILSTDLVRLFQYTERERERERDY